MKRVFFFLLQKPVGKSFINFERKPKKVEIDYRVWRHQTDLRIKCSSRENFYTSATFLGILEVHLRKTFWGKQSLSATLLNEVGHRFSR